MTAPAGTGAAAWALESTIGRLLVAGTWLAMALLAVGVVLTLASGVDPLAHGPVPPFDPSTIPADLAAPRPAGYLWAGILLVIALPVGRVVVAGLAFVAAREWRMAAVSALVLAVVLVSIAAAIGLEG